MSKPIAGILATNISVLVLGLGSSVVLNRALGPEGKGLYATLLTTSQLIVMLASLGLGKSVTFYLANREENQRSVFEVFLSTTILAIGLCLLVGLGLSAISTRGEVYRGTGFLCLAALSIFSLLHASGIGVLRGLHQFDACNAQSLVTSVIFIAAVIVLAFGTTMNPMLAAGCKAFSFMAGLLWIWPKLKPFGFRLRPRFEAVLAKKMVAYGLGFFFYALFQNLSYRLDLILVAHMSSLAEAGCYSTASGLAEIIWYLPNAISTVLFPVIAGLNDQERDRLVCKTCRWSLWIMASGVLGLVVLSPVGIPLLYGHQFFPAIGAVYALSFGILTNGMFQILGIHLAAKKRLGTLTFITASGFAVNLLLNLILIPRFGIIGAGLSSTVSYSVSGFMTAWVFCKTTGLGLGELLLIPKQEMIDVTRSALKKLNPQPGPRPS